MSSVVVWAIASPNRLKVFLSFFRLFRHRANDVCSNGNKQWKRREREREKENRFLRILKDNSIFKRCHLEGQIVYSARPWRPRPYIHYKLLTKATNLKIDNEFCWLAEQTTSHQWAVVVAQLVERSLSTSEIRVRIQPSENFIHIWTILKRRRLRKRGHKWFNFYPMSIEESNNAAINGLIAVSIEKMKK